MDIARLSSVEARRISSCMQKRFKVGGDEIPQSENKCLVRCLKKVSFPGRRTVKVL